jgi:nitroreductase
MHAASSLPDAPAVAAWRSAPPRLDWPAPTGLPTALQPLASGELPDESIENVIARRGSSRRFAREPISFPQLSTILERSMRGFQADFRRAPEGALAGAYLIANAVEGLAPGAYVYHRKLQSLELLQAGDMRGMAGYLGLQQELAADSSVNIYWLAELPPILGSLGNRGYRAAQFDASLAAGRVYLAAYALGLGATGLTFYDDEVTRFFSPHAQGKNVMFLMAVGRNAKRR